MIWRVATVAAGLLAASLQLAAAQTVLTLSANGNNNVDPDRVIASLDVACSAADAAHAQAQVNQLMGQALSDAKAVSGVTASTGDYSVTQATPDGTRDGTPDNASGSGSQKPVFQASQNLQLSMAASGAPPAAFINLVGELQQKGLLLNSLNGDLSAKGQQAAQQGAIDDALRQIRDQAKAVATALGENPGEIQTLDINVNMPGPVMRMAPMMMAAAPPQLAPGKMNVQANINATIALTRKSAF